MTRFTVNGNPVQYELPADTPLLWALRDASNLTGTKYGCGIGMCGACTVHIDGNATRSCQVTIGAIEGTFVTTIEGLSDDRSHPLDVRVPTALGAPMRVADAHAERWVLAAHLTYRCHERRSSRESYWGQGADLRFAGLGRPKRPGYGMAPALISSKRPARSWANFVIAREAPSLGADCTKSWVLSPAAMTARESGRPHTTGSPTIWV